MYFLYNTLKKLWNSITTVDIYKNVIIIARKYTTHRLFYYLILCSESLTSLHKFPNALRSGDWLGHSSRAFIFFFFQKPRFCFFGCVSRILVLLDDLASFHFHRPGWRHQVLIKYLSVQRQIHLSSDNLNFTNTWWAKTAPDHYTTSSKLHGGDNVFWLGSSFAKLDCERFPELSYFRFIRPNYLVPKLLRSFIQMFVGIV